MKLKVDFSVFIRVSIDGTQNVSLLFYKDKYRILSCIPELCSTASTVTKLIETINDIHSNKIPEIALPSTTNDDPPAFTLHLTYNNAEFINEYSANESVTITTAELKEILFEFLYFLNKYENNEIPNLIYTLQKE